MMVYLITNGNERLDQLFLSQNIFFKDKGCWLDIETPHPHRITFCFKNAITPLL